MNASDEQRRGIEAQQLLGNTLLTEAMATIEARIVDQLASADTPPDKVARLQALLVAKRTFHRYLAQVVQTGTMAALEENEKRKRSMFDMIRRA